MKVEHAVIRGFGRIVRADHRGGIADQHGVVALAQDPFTQVERAVIRAERQRVELADAEREEGRQRIGKGIAQQQDLSVGCVQIDAVAQPIGVVQALPGDGAVPVSRTASKSGLTTAEYTTGEPESAPIRQTS